MLLEERKFWYYIALNEEEGKWKTEWHQIAFVVVAV
jgi:hypothetical protein